MKPSSDLITLSSEIRIILLAVSTHYPARCRNVEAIVEAAKIVAKEEKMRKALIELEDLSRDTGTTRQKLRDGIQKILRF